VHICTQEQLLASLKKAAIQVGIWVFILQEAEQFSLKFKLCCFLKLCYLTPPRIRWFHSCSMKKSEWIFPVVIRMQITSVWKWIAQENIWSKGWDKGGIKDNIQRSILWPIVDSIVKTKEARRLGMWKGKKDKCTQNFCGEIPCLIITLKTEEDL
jgi:hypothetical protein